MVEFYTKKIIRGEKLWTEVPKLWNEKVKTQLILDGYVLNEDGTVTKIEE